MKCSEFSDLLDQWIDGELTGEESAAFERHAAECADCHAKMTASGQLRELLSCLNDDVTVPMPAQAAWRSAIRAEARRGRARRVYTALGAVAAVCVLTLGAAAMLRQGLPAPNETSNQPQVLMLEADGVSDKAQLDAASEASAVPSAEAAAEKAASVQGNGAYLADDGARESGMRSSAASTTSDEVRLNIVSDDPEEAYAYLMDVVAEYGATLETEFEYGEERGAYVSVSAENASDFVRAVNAIGNAEDADEIDASNYVGETVPIYIFISAE